MKMTMEPSLISPFPSLPISHYILSILSLHHLTLSASTYPVIIPIVFPRRLQWIPEWLFCVPLLFSSSAFFFFFSSEAKAKILKSGQDTPLVILTAPSVEARFILALGPSPAFWFRVSPPSSLQPCAAAWGSSTEWRVTAFVLFPLRHSPLCPILICSSLFTGNIPYSKKGYGP